MDPERWECHTPRLQTGDLRQRDAHLGAAAQVPKRFGAHAHKGGLARAPPPSQERQPSAEDAATARELDSKFWQTRQGRALKRDLERRVQARSKLEQLFSNEQGGRERLPRLLFLLCHMQRGLLHIYAI